MQRQDRRLVHSGMLVADSQLRDPISANIYLLREALCPLNPSGDNVLWLVWWENVERRRFAPSLNCMRKDRKLALPYAGHSRALNSTPFPFLAHPFRQIIHNRCTQIHPLSVTPTPYWRQRWPSGKVSALEPEVPGSKPHSPEDPPCIGPVSC
ncbi:hypothetical protein AVEN_100901-1 [Araneus ventricosus]|uniref:Uncharacterized protein n=1 Tax=Araneus ventricosus TaxID=182803 RepID=A0A4Y2AVG7_ARAVE|nr:hypothetical protein AVEN_100901-1 [Araneus ventricosus]